ncbi:hypothetical protein GCM10009630_10350 [Kribbella jejuensis]|uniref:SnoaL-like protein n=1 Tax=Kribbella jejuensis TaxID=236068 RepID=A0A542EA64_9ACTN|nr:nuclear transport factor 2 family protein [Kribbella jejuensis]TQJ12222.1 SnoaL-like protein [Kribbella jejuensis]
MNPLEPADVQDQLANLYRAFNDRDLSNLLAAMTPDVAWPNGWEGGVVHGHDELSDYWQRQWAEIEPTVVPTAFTTEADGRTAVTVHQVVRDKTGNVLSDHQVLHIYRFANGLVAQMEIRESPR